MSSLKDGLPGQDGYNYNIEVILPQNINCFLSELQGQVIQCFQKVFTSLLSWRVSHFLLLKNIPHSLMLPPPHFTLGMVFRPGTHTKELNLCLIRPNNFLPHGLRGLQGTLGGLPHRPDWWMAAEMVVLLEGSTQKVLAEWPLASKALLPPNLS